MPDQVLVKLSDGTFVRKPLSEALKTTAVVAVPGPAVVAVAASKRFEPTTAAATTVFAGPAPFHDDGLDAVAERIVQQCAVPSSDDVLGRRLHSFITLFLTGRVKLKEIEAFLLRSPKIGGLGFDSGAAKTCIDVITRAAATGPYTTASLERALPAPPKPEPPVIAPSAPVATSTVFAQLPTPPPRARQPIIPVVEAPKASQPPSIPVINTETPPVTVTRPSKPAPAPVRAPVTRAATENGTPSRPSLVDIRPPEPRSGASTGTQRWWPGGNKSASTLVSPAGEFQLTLEDFRRLADTADGRIEVLKRKTEALAKENYSTKIAAVEYWKHSVVFLLYLEIGRESLKRLVPVPETIKKLAAEGKETLTAEEFRAIGALNEWLGL